MGEVSVKGAEHALCPVASEECRDTVAQSTSQTTRRPPGRRTRLSQRRRGRPRTPAPAPPGRRRSRRRGPAGGRPVKWSSTLSWPCVRCLARARVGAGVDADQRPGGPDVLDQLSEVEAGATTDVQDALAGAASRASRTRRRRRRTSRVRYRVSIWVARPRRTPAGSWSPLSSRWVVLVSAGKELRHSGADPAGVVVPHQVPPPSISSSSARGMRPTNRRQMSTDPPGSAVP